MTLDYVYRCPAEGCAYAAAVVGETRVSPPRLSVLAHAAAPQRHPALPPRRGYRLRCAAGHRMTSDLPPREVAR